jgi:Cu2+-exporting ATPase
VNPFHWIKKADDTVIAGTINGNKSFVMIAKNWFRNLSQIVQMVNSASRSRAPIQNWPTE